MKSFVAGFSPAIHEKPRRRFVDARTKSGHERFNE